MKPPKLPKTDYVSAFPDFTTLWYAVQLWLRAAGVDRHR